MFLFEAKWMSKTVDKLKKIKNNVRKKEIMNKKAT